MALAMSTSLPGRPAEISLHVPGGKGGDFWASSLVPVVISLGNKPGAMELTLIPSLQFAISTASILVRWIVAALAAFEANRLSDSLIRPFIDDILMTVLVWPGLASLARCSRGRNAVVTK